MDCAVVQRPLTYRGEVLREFDRLLKELRSTRGETQRHSRKRKAEMLKSDDDVTKASEETKAAQLLLCCVPNLSALQMVRCGEETKQTCVSSVAPYPPPKLFSVAHWVRELRIL